MYCLDKHYIYTDSQPNCLTLLHTAQQKNLKASGWFLKPCTIKNAIVTADNKKTPHK